jgi:hypothetical protein
MNFSDFKNVVWKEGDHYIAQSLNIDVSSFGSTKQDALTNLKEALELYFEDMPISSASRIEDVELVVM